jgi:membrane-bound serine protease (ClpP class)
MSDPHKAKQVNDAIAYIRSLAQLRGRNVEWAERAVRHAASLPAEEALETNVVDLIANDVEDLLAKIDGRTVNVMGKDRVLDTADVDVVTIEPDWRNRLLSVITDPNILPILMTLGMLGLLYELINPGFVLPGVLGAICLVLALYASQVLPVNYAGVALILLGIAFMVGEAFAPSFGALGIGGVIAFIIGSIILIDTEAPGFGVSIPFIVTFGVVMGMLFFGLMTMVMKVRRSPIVSGREQLVGASGEVLESFDAQGRVRVHSETWTARSEQPLQKGDRVRVVGVEGLLLDVERDRKPQE